MRKGEIASLRWEDMDGDVIVLAGKNAKNGEGRTIPCEGELAGLIARRRAARALKVGDTVTLCGLIFHRGGKTIREFIVTTSSPRVIFEKQRASWKRAKDWNVRHWKNPARPSSGMVAPKPGYPHTTLAFAPLAN